MDSTLFSIALAVVLLGAGALLTNLVVHAMDITCERCGALNTRRRTRYRHCGQDLRASAPENSSR